MIHDSVMHTPVLLKEVIEYLDPKEGDKIIDATFDGGGHSLEIIKHIGAEGKIIGVEIDIELLQKISARGGPASGRKNKIPDTNLILVNDSYTNLEKIVKQYGFENVDGILFDLGLSSWHLEESGKGFTFQKNEPLDMRFDARESLTASDIVNNFSFDELVKILKEYGEERFSRSIAKKIIEQRKIERIKTTYGLVGLISSAVPAWYKRGRIHFATKTFQALRIAVNKELDNLTIALDALPKLLKEKGRLVVVSFHGLEDRIVKNKFREWGKEGLFEILTKKPITPSVEEVKNNPRSRSAKLRAVQKS